MRSLLLHKSVIRLERYMKRTREILACSIDGVAIAKRYITVGIPVVDLKWRAICAEHDSNPSLVSYYDLNQKS